MPYQIDVDQTRSLLVSHITSYDATDEELDVYLTQFVALANAFFETGERRIYHINVIEPRGFDFLKGLRSLRVIQRHKPLADLRQRMTLIPILVGHTPKRFQILITLVSHSPLSQGQIAVFDTLDHALSFVRDDRISQINAHQ